MIQLIQETVSGVPAPSFKSAAMERGIEMEPAAIEAYEAHTLSVVEPAGFFVHPHIHLAGASPDGLVSDCGLVEVKCPESHTHLDTLIASQNPRRQAVRHQYLVQMQFQMACTGRQWCDFVSYDDRWPPHLRLYIERVPRDETLIAELEAGVMDFLEEMADRIKTLEDFKQ
jgi:putative phage-type endonuclease